jgi:hypothetical protein
MVFPYQCNQSAPKGEQNVYNLLKAEYGSSEQITVFHEVRIQATRERNREYEIDFVVATSKYIVCVEVKGGNVQFDVENNRWTQNGHILSSPVDQAIDNKHAFVNRFRSDLNEIQVYWAVCFPDVSVVGQLPTQADDINVIDSAKLTYINEYFRSVESVAYSARRSDPFPSRNANYALRRILGSLTRGFGFEPSIQSRLESNATVFAELLEQQLEIVEGLEENNKLMIKGNAGTGKSLVGLHQLFRRYELNEKVLFLTFNRQLAKNFSYLVKRDFSIREDEEPAITNFHQIARRIITDFAPGWWEDIHEKNEDFWDLEVPSKLDECLPAPNYIYDFIVIDEAQDFVDIWLDPIMKLLSPKGKISLLMDGKQDIFERASRFRDSGFTSFRLDKVIRSSRKNTDFVNNHLNLNLTPHRRVPEGTGVINLSNESNAYDLLSASLVEFGIRANQVTFIYKPSVGLRQFENFSVGRDRISRNRDPYARRGEISAVSVAFMKGLECDIAAIIGLDSMTEAEQYVALTRSKNLIYLL